MKRSTILVRALVAAAALLVPLGLATPASAGTYYTGCTIDPVTPYANGDLNANGVKMVNYEVDVDCASGREVEIEMRRWEYDANNADDLIGTSTLHNSFYTAGGTLTRTVEGALPNTDDFGDNVEEMYQCVRFRVTLTNLFQTPFTAWECTPYRSIHI
ncbi:hypothetical protein Val02_09380 [Virgisporangium aliadipatigenens]|uniref:Secreted protein n=1 Tax=Virgisporangium aliadipatigenens TaxID=741659 RepID=A0A8J4DP26_9ACTN|nr:hypothetical protein [Virgisporangium aliadipatigenens]GIJ44052.1 hypothetical protein Val02_09380 [Virgisporangium aliadipatigenens]